MSAPNRWSKLSLERLRTAEPPPRRATAALSETAAAAAEEFGAPPMRPAQLLTGVATLDVATASAALFGGLMLAEPGAAPAVAAAAALTGGVAVAAGLALTGGYRLRLLRSFWPSWLRAAATGAALAAGPVFFGVWSWPAWGAAAAQLALGFALWRGLLAPLAAWLIDSRATERRAVIVGGGGNAEKLIRGLAENPDNAIRVVGMFDDRGDHRSPPLVAGVRKLGSIAELVAFARRARIDMLIVTLPLSAEKRILSILRELWVLPVDVRLSAYSADFTFAGGGLIGLRDRPLADWSRLAKRALDIAGAALALVALSPVMLATALAIRLDSSGPVFFRQQRHGYNDQPIRVLKFRSMYAESCDPKARGIVTKGDPRVTRVGRIIRKTSIDELPQLFNVLAGALSLVGPRPHALVAKSSREELFAEIVDGYSGRHRVPPGITGWAQIHGLRGEVDDADKLKARFEHDLYYIENWSIWLDLKILLRTPLSLFDTRAAY